MAFILISTIFMTLIFSTSAQNGTHPIEDITITMQEMQCASYFTFVMLLKMVKENLPKNATFLMPSDRALSKASVSEDKVLEFIFRHSIPSAISFKNFQHFPTGTMVPTYKEDYMLTVVNRGRREFYFDNVRIAANVDICKAGSSFRCHGIYGVLDMKAENGTILPTPTPSVVQPSPAPSRIPAPPFVVGPPSSFPLVSPSPIESLAPVDEPRKSSSLIRVPQGLFMTPVLCLLLLNFLKLLY